METKEEVGGSMGTGKGLHSGAAEKQQAGVAKGLVRLWDRACVLSPNCLAHRLCDTGYMVLYFGKV